MKSHNFTYHVLHVSALNPVLLPGVLPQQEDWQTGQKAAEDVVDEAALAEAAGVGADEAWPAEQSAQAEADVSATITQALVPAIRHLGFLRVRTFFGRLTFSECGQQKLCME